MILTNLVSYLFNAPQADAKKKLDNAVKAFMRDLDKEAEAQQRRLLNGHRKPNGRHDKNGG